MSFSLRALHLLLLVRKFMKIAARNQNFFGSELSTVPASFGSERWLKWDGNISNYSENCQISLRALREVTLVRDHFTTDTILTQS